MNKGKKMSATKLYETVALCLEISLSTVRRMCMPQNDQEAAANEEVG